jgi:hypothetical protein
MPLHGRFPLPDEIFGSVTVVSTPIGKEKAEAFGSGCMNIDERWLALL